MLFCNELDIVIVNSLAPFGEYGWHTIITMAIHFSGSYYSDLFVTKWLFEKLVTSVFWKIESEKEFVELRPRSVE